MDSLCTRQRICSIIYTEISLAIQEDYSTVTISSQFEQIHSKTNNGFNQRRTQCGNFPFSNARSTSDRPRINPKAHTHSLETVRPLPNLNLSTSTLSDSVLPGRATFISNQETHHEVSKVRHVSLSAPYYMLFKRKREPSRIPSVKREEMFWAFQLELQSRSASLSERSREILDARFNMPDWTLRETPLAHFPGEEEYTGRVEEFSGIMGDGIVLLWKYYNGDIKKTRIKTFQGTNGQVWVNAKQIFYALMFTTHEPNENMSVEETEERIEQYHLNTLRKYGTQDLTAEEQYVLDCESNLSEHSCHLFRTHRLHFPTMY